MKRSIDESPMTADFQRRVFTHRSMSRRSLQKPLLSFLQISEKEQQGQKQTTAAEHVSQRASKKT
jgi:hypothetical protein